jgi:hypothetical protein
LYIVERNAATVEINGKNNISEILKRVNEI